MARKLVFILTTLVAGLALAVVIAVARPAAGTSADANLDSEEQTFLTLINNYRAQNGLGALQTTAVLNNSADWMSDDMGVNSYFDHYDMCDWQHVDCTVSHQQSTTLTRSPWTRMCNFGYCYNTWMAENIAAGYTSAQAVFNAWKASPGHNANMLGPNYKVIGIARVYVAGSPYGYYWTNDFGGTVPPGTPTGTTPPTPSPTPSPTKTPSPTPSPAPSPSPTKTPSSTASLSPSPSPTKTPSPTPSPSLTPTPSPSPSPTKTLSATPTPTATPSPTPTPTATPSPTPTPTATPSPTPNAVLPATSTAKPAPTPKIIHDISITAFTVVNEARAGDTKPIAFRLLNRGTQAELVSYGLTATCLDGQPNKVLECGSLQYSPVCTGTVTLSPGQSIEIHCSVTYNTSTYHDRWRHTLRAFIPLEMRPADNVRVVERSVL